MQNRRGGSANVTGWIDARPRSLPSTGTRDSRARAGRRVLRAEMTPAEPEHGQGTKRDGDDLRKREHERRGPDHPQRREEHEERIDMAAEAHHLLAGRGLRDLERTALRRAPNRLDHVPEVEPPFAEVHEARTRDDEEDRAPRRHRPAQPSVHLRSRTNAAPNRNSPLARRPRCRGGRRHPRSSDQRGAGVSAPTEPRERDRSARLADCESDRHGRDRQRPGGVERRRMSTARRDEHSQRHEPEVPETRLQRARRPRAAARSSGARRSARARAMPRSRRRTRSARPRDARAVRPGDQTRARPPARAPAPRQRAGRDRARRYTRCTSLRRSRGQACAGDPDSRPCQRSRSRATTAPGQPRRRRTPRSAPNIRLVAASQTTSGQRKNFAASVIPMLADDAKRRSRNRQAIAAASANQSVTLPVWIAEITGGHRSSKP